VSEKVTIARIPVGQPLELSSALFGFFGAALKDCAADPGDGWGNAAEVVVGENVTLQQVVTQLRRATTRLQRKPKTAKPEPADVEPADELDPDDPLTLNRMRSTPDGGVEFGIGGGGDMAREMATNLLAAFIPAFEEHPDAVNYLSWDATVPETGRRYSLIVVRPDGLTPHEARQRAEQEVERLRELCEANGIDTTAREEGEQE
jgi:hypothetical protein